MEETLTAGRDSIRQLCTGHHSWSNFDKTFLSKHILSLERCSWESCVSAGTTPQGCLKSSHHHPLMVVWNPKKIIWLYIWLPFKGIGAIHFFFREKNCISFLCVRKAEDSSHNTHEQLDQFFLVREIFIVCYRMHMSRNYLANTWSQPIIWRSFPIGYFTNGFRAPVYENVIPRCISYFKKAEQSSGRQVALNYHCEGHLVLNKSAYALYLIN